MTPGTESGLSAIIGTSFIAAIVLAWQQIRSVFSRFFGLIVVNVGCSGEAATGLQTYCWNTMRQSPSGFRDFIAMSKFVQPRERYQTVGFELVGNRRRVFWTGWKPIMLHIAEGQLHATFIRGMFDAEQLVIDAIEWQNKNQNEAKDGRYYVTSFVGSKQRSTSDPSSNGVLAKSPSGESPPATSPAVDDTNFKPLKWTRDQLGMPSDHKGAADHMALSQDQQAALIEAQHWFDSKAWYLSRKIPWRRGWLLYGVPGTGKTSLVRVAAQTLEIPIFVFDLASMNNGEFQHYWSVVRAHAPVIVLFEDIDNVFHLRENVLGELGGKLSFDTLLNAIAGVENADGIFTMVTTNRRELVDPALARAGRLDLHIECTALTEEGCRKIATRILSDCPHLIDDIVKDGVGNTGAAFQEHCGSIALAYHWKTKETYERLKIEQAKAHAQRQDRPPYGHNGSVPTGVGAGGTRY